MCVFTSWQWVCVSGLLILNPRLAQARGLLGGNTHLWMPHLSGLNLIRTSGLSNITLQPSPWPRLHPSELWGHVTGSHFGFSPPLSWTRVTCRPGIISQACPVTLPTGMSARCLRFTPTLGPQRAPPRARAACAWEHIKAQESPGFLAALQALAQWRDLDSILVNSTGPRGSNTMIFMLAGWTAKIVGLLCRRGSLSRGQHFWHLLIGIWENWVKGGRGPLELQPTCTWTAGCPVRFWPTPCGPEQGWGGGGWATESQSCQKGSSEKEENRKEGEKKSKRPRGKKKNREGSIFRFASIELCAVAPGALFLQGQFSWSRLGQAFHPSWGRPIRFQVSCKTTSFREPPPKTPRSGSLFCPVLFS